MPYALEFNDITVTFQSPDAPEQRYTAVAGTTLRIKAGEFVSVVGLAEFGDRYPHQLSGGMRKRTALAQVLALDPDIILMDEPFSAPDVQTRQLMENEVLDLWAAKKKAVLFITH